MDWTKPPNAGKRRRADSKPPGGDAAKKSRHDGSDEDLILIDDHGFKEGGDPVDTDELWADLYDSTYTPPKKPAAKSPKASRAEDDTVSKFKDTPVSFGTEMEFFYALHRHQFIRWQREPLGAAKRKPFIGVWNRSRDDPLMTYVKHVLLCSPDTTVPGRNQRDAGLPFFDFDVVVSTGKAASEKIGYHYSWQIAPDASLIARDSNIVTRHNIQAGDNEAAERDWYHGGMELISPILTLGDSFDKYGQKYALVQQELRETVGTQGAYVGDDCGLHCHVAFHDEEISLATIQNLFVLYGVYEDEIDTMHVQKRRENNKFWCMSLRSRMHSNYNHQRFAKAIYNSRSIGQLEQLGCDHFCRDSKNFKLHISGPRLPGKRYTTIEFRQHAGTLDATQIQHWVLFCGSMLRLARAYASMDYQFMDVPESNFGTEASVFHGIDQPGRTLMDRLDLKEPEKAWWRNRIAELRA